MNKRLYQGLLLLCVNTIFATQALALQEVRVSDGQTVSATFSKNELTRLTAGGKAQKITDVWSGNENFDAQVDEKTGSIFVQPSLSAPSIFSFFVQDDTNSVYTVVANLQDIPSDTVKFINVKPNKYFVSADPNGNTTSSRKSKIRNFMLAMYKQDKNSFIVESKDEIIPFWKEAQINHIARFIGEEYIGDAYKVKNITNSEMVLNEQEFITFGNNVEAISLSVTQVKPQEHTLLLIVRSPAQGED